MINYNEVIDYLNTLITDENGKKWYMFETHKYHNIEEDIIVIDLIDTGNDNSYNLYHSLLNDGVDTNEDLIKCCIEELKNIFDNIKTTMMNILSNDLNNSK